MRAGLKWLRDQRGSTAVLVGLSFTLLLTVTGLVVDGGTMYAAKSHLQKTANAAALSGAQELTRNKTDVQAVVDDILQRHGEITSLAGTDIDMKSLVRVRLNKKVPLSFSRLFGKKDVTVAVKAAAQVAPMGEAVGAFPFGVDDSIDLVKYKKYTLLDGPHGGQRGFYGILDLGGLGPGPHGYEQNLINGYQGEVTVGDTVDTLMGIKAGQSDVINDRINSDPYPDGEYWHRDNPRVLLIPLYHSTGHKEVEITGFAYFYLTAPYTKKDKELIGMFIDHAGTGFIKPGAPDKGAYAIRLVE